MLILKRKTCTKIFFILLLAICNSFLFGGDLEKTQKETLRALGITFNSFEGFESRPISFPDMLINQSTKVKGYRENDIWRYKQFAAEWSDNSSSIEVYEMLYHPPEKTDTFLTELEVTENFRVTLKSVLWSKQEKVEWLEAYTGKKIVKEKPSLTNKYGSDIEYFPVSDAKYFYGLFVVSNKKYLDKNLVFLYKIQSSLPKKQVMRAVFSSIKSVKFNKSQKKSSNGKAKSSSVKSSYQESRERVERSIRNLKDWWGVQSKDFFIITNYPKTSKGFIQRIKKMLTDYQGIYKRYYKQTGPPKEMNVVRIFDERDDYIAYVGKDKEFSGGLWMPSKKELVISSVPKGSKEFQEEQQIKTIRHEAFHQYLHYALDEIQVSVWFNEGNATFFENVTKIGNRVKIEPSKTYLTILKRMLNQPLNIENMLKMKHEQFYAGNGTKEGIGNNYALAWGIVYFLREGAPKIKQIKGHDYTKIIKKYYYYIRKTQSPEEATELAWKKIDMKEFEKDFRYYYENLN